ncbi:CPCC family cysteine-rich protein [Streptomyces sp. G-5]|uniref:CPCC family cysteine-rich protein n=1 Tax=unclassified Streptomyces TaxID=2593676 RepID=UPI003977DF8E
MRRLSDRSSPPVVRPGARKVGLNSGGSSGCAHRRTAPFEDPARITRTAGQDVPAHLVQGAYEICPVCFWEDDQDADAVPRRPNGRWVW